MAFLCIWLIWVFVLLWNYTGIPNTVGGIPSEHQGNIFSLTWLSITLPWIPNAAIASSKAMSIYIRILCVCIPVYDIHKYTLFAYVRLFVWALGESCNGYFAFGFAYMSHRWNLETHCRLIQEVSPLTFWTGYGRVGITPVESDCFLFMANLSHFLCLTVTYKLTHLGEPGYIHTDLKWFGWTDDRY